MVFPSPTFLFLFLPLALLLYYAAPRFLKPLVLTLLSYLFYGWWNPWLLPLLLASTCIDYGCGSLISRPNATPHLRRTGLWISIGANLSLLAFFKYAGFFAGSAATVSQGTLQFPAWVYAIPLPIGISFYTFQSMSYSIDLYRGRVRPARSFLEFACFVSLFPQLIAGPIVRYATLADQLRSRSHTLPGFVLGWTRFCYGFAKKVLLANPLGEIADTCFAAGPESLGPGAAWIGVIAFAFQIFFDFSGYSDMALGLGRLFGFRFPENFNAPYRAASLTEFWRRWHISLSSFLRDYLYLPLGGNRKGLTRTMANLLLVMLLGGLWHGAQWTFLIWGGLHGLLLVLERLPVLSRSGQLVPRPIRVAFTFTLLLLTWVFFRAETLDQAGHYLAALFGLTELHPSRELVAIQVFRPFNLFLLLLCLPATWLLPPMPRYLSDLGLAKILTGLLLFLLALAMMFYQDYQPFLYFQF